MSRIEHYWLVRPGQNQDQWTPVSVGNPLPVQIVSGGGNPTFEDASGTIAAGTFTNQQALAAGLATKYFYIFNNDVQEILYLNFTGAAGNGANPSDSAIPILPMQGWVMDTQIPANEFDIAAATVGHKFIIKYA